MRAESGIFKGLNAPMTMVSLGIVIVFLLFGVLAPEYSADLFGRLSGAIISGFKWYYILIVAGFLVFALYLLFSRLGDLKLGDDDQEPEFGYFAWFSMLFGAGMGIGLVFWSIAEPMFHFQGNPLMPEEAAGTAAAAQVAMRITYFHWGLHPWAIYVIVGLSLAFFSYRRKLPLSIRSVLYPILGERIYGFWGNAADVLAVFGTVFGIATSLGFGVVQMNTGLNQLFGMPIGTGYQILLIAIVSAIATVSVVSGVGKGVRILSELNLWLSIAILAFFLFFGPTSYLLNLFVQALGDYLLNIVPLSFWTNAGAGPAGTAGWQASWTAFYWGWWISWAPFVGMFIARISRGRTVREFILGVLLVPTLLAIFWLTVFGGTALYIELWDVGGIVEAVNEDVTLALYQTIGAMDAGAMSVLFAGVATLLIATYFITSSDSGTLVITTLLSLGDMEPPTIHRVIWGLGEGLVAAVLLLSGGLAALQSAAIIAALPFSVIMLFMCWGLVRGLSEEYELMNRVERERERQERQPWQP